jgi:hypothetical protein
MKIKNPYIVGLAICMLAIFIYSCRKELSHKIETAPEAEWAKDYFTQSLLPNEGNMVDGRNYLPNGLSGNLRSSKKENFKTPIWQRSKTGKTALYDFVETPIAYTTKVMPIIYREDPDGTAPREIDKDVLRASLDRLVIYKDKKGKINQRLISFVPSSAYLKRHNGDISHNQINKLDKDFEGFLVYRKWDGNFLFALVIKDGKAVKKMSLRKQEMKFKKTVFMKRRACETIEVYEVFIDCEYANPDDRPNNPSSCGPPYEEYVGSYDVCTPDSPCLDPENYNTAECGGDEGEGGDHEEDTRDCAGVIGGSATRSTCGCIGGTTGIPDCSTDPCNQAKIMNFKLSNTAYSGQNASIDSKNNSKEWGAEINLAADGFTPSSTTVTSNDYNAYTPSFSWNDTNGYTVGFNHNHTINGYPAPSPEDLLLPFAKAYSPTVVSSGKQALYQANMSVGIRNSNEKYLVTVKDWTGLYNQYDGHSVSDFYPPYNAAISNYFLAHPNALPAEASENAFLTVFGANVNFLKLNATTGKYEPFELTSNGVTKKNCP